MKVEIRLALSRCGGSKLASVSRNKKKKRTGGQIFWCRSLLRHDVSLPVRELITRPDENKNGRCWTAVGASGAIARQCRENRSEKFDVTESLLHPKITFKV